MPSHITPLEVSPSYFYILQLLTNFYIVFDEPIDVVRSLRGNKINIRKAFSYLFCLVSGVAFFLVMVGQITKKFSPGP